MTTCVIVESMSGYEAANKELTGKKVRWLATSPALLRRIDGIDSLERGLAQDQVDAVGKAAHGFAEKYSRRLDEICHWRGAYELGPAFMTQIRALFHVCRYKAMLMDHAAGQYEQVVCVGDPHPVRPRGLSGLFGRFDTVFACLAAAAGGPFSVMEHELSRQDLVLLERGVVHRKLGLIEKTLSVLSNTPGSFAYKLWKNLSARRIYPWKSVALKPAARHRMFIHKDCELLEEFFANLLLKGVRLQRLGGLPVLDAGSEAPGPPEGAARLEDEFMRLAREANDEYGLDWTAATEAAMRLAWSRHIDVVANFAAGFKELESGFESATRDMRAGDAVIGNFFTTPEEILFRFYCRERGFVVAAFEHGVTLGLSEWGKWSDVMSGMRYADIGVYHSARAAEAIEKAAPDQKQIIADLPRVTRKTALAGLKRRLARKWLGMGAREHIVVYVADLEKNNFQYGPCIDNDLQYLEKTEAVIDYLAASYPDSKVLLKTYPTRRYVDLHEFDDKQQEHENVFVVKDREYRFMRGAADLTVFTSSQSTLGWVIHSGTPHLFIEFDWAPSLLCGAEFGPPRIKGASRALIVDPVSISGSGDEDPAGRLVELVQEAK